MDMTDWARLLLAGSLETGVGEGGRRWMSDTAAMSRHTTHASSWLGSLLFRIMTLVPCGFGKTDSSTADLCFMSQADQLGSLRLTETRGQIYPTQK